MTTTLKRHETVARRVRGFMAERERTQAELAAVLGIAQTNVSQRYRGKRAYSVDELDVIARWLDVRIEDLFRTDYANGGERRVNSGWSWRERIARRAPRTVQGLRNAA